MKRKTIHKRITKTIDKMKTKIFGMMLLPVLCFLLLACGDSQEDRNRPENEIISLQSEHINSPENAGNGSNGNPMASPQDSNGDENGAGASGNVQPSA